MIDLTATHLALRARARTLSVCTTGLQTMGATTAGFTWASGSFLDAGFYPGMQLVGVGYNANNNAPKVVDKVQTGLLTIVGGCEVQNAAGSRSLSVGLPIKRDWENKKFVQADAAGFPYVSEQFVPATHTLWTMTSNGGHSEETGIYALTLFGLSDYGIPAIRKYVDGLRALYAPGTSLSAGSNTVSIRGDVAPQSGQITPQGNGWSTCILRVFWRAFSRNTVAA
jgi:hypothetical protein